MLHCYSAEEGFEGECGMRAIIKGSMEKELYNTVYRTVGPLKPGAAIRNGDGHSVLRYPP